MNVSYRWLQDYVHTPTPPDQLGEHFRMTSSEMEGIRTYSGFDHIVTGYITKVEPHPDADRLKVASVRIGNSQKQIVTAASNVTADRTCIVALEGAVVHMDNELVTIKPTKLRGVLSEGMFCSLSELGFPITSEGIWLSTDQSIPQGEPVASALELEDSVLDLEITPNRPDLLSYVGLAREVSAFEHRSLIEPTTKTDWQTTSATPTKVTIDDASLCQRYSAVRIRGNLAIESPWWLQRRLLVSGIRPSSLVVDVTNYVMLELGQPLHAFQATEEHLSIRVRSAQKGEKLLLLDGSERELAPGDILVCSSDNEPVALGGIMGGKDSSIAPGTTDVLIESAHFTGSQIRRTSRRLGLRTEASSRFEKGTDPEMCVTALNRALTLIQQVCDIQVIGTMSDVRSVKPHTHQPIHLSFDRIQDILGVHISAQETRTILSKLGCSISHMSKSAFDVVPPSWRSDIQLPEDIVEELIRIWGYDRIPSQLISGPVLAPEANHQFHTKHRIRRILAAQGAQECVSVPFVSERSLELCKLDPAMAIRLPNPLSSETAFLSPSHLVQLMQGVAGDNLLNESLILFEIGSVFAFPTEERQVASILLRSNQDLERVVRHAKQLVTAVVDGAGVHDLQWEFGDMSAHARSGSDELAVIEVVDPDIVRAHKLRRGKSLVFVEINLSKLLNQKSTHKSYQPAPTFPSVTRDLTVTLPERTQIADLNKAVAAVHSKLLASYEVTDIFRGNPVQEDHKAITLRFTYNGGDHTLTDSEVATEHQHFIDACRTLPGASLTE